MPERLNLVTGACGFSGMHVVKLLLDAGQRVIALDRAGTLSHERTQRIAKHIGLSLDHPNLERLPADLTDPSSLTGLRQMPITHVFHTASLYDYSASWELLASVNIDGFLHLLDALKGAPLERFIHWSTCGVFGHPYPLSKKGKGNVPFSETSPSPKTEPFGAEGPSGTYLVNQYSVSKWKQEQLAWKAYRESGLPLTVVRPGPMYGPGSDYGHGGIILTIHKGLVPIIPKDGRNFVTTSVHVLDMARFACYIAEKPDAVGEDFNVLDDSVMSYNAFLQYIALLTGRKMREIPLIHLRAAMPFALAAARFWRWLEVRFGVRRVRVFEPGSAVYIGSSYWISNSKSKAWGFTYRYPDVHEGLRDTIEWFQAIGWMEKAGAPGMQR